MPAFRWKLVQEYDLKFKFNFVLALCCTVKQCCPLSVVSSVAGITNSRETLPELTKCSFVIARLDNPDERGLLYLVFRSFNYERL